MKKKLNIGCERDYLDGWVNVDFDTRFKADIRHNLNKFPYPFKDDTFDEVLASAILEHLDDIYKLMAEIYRISKDKALIHILVPYQSSPIRFCDIEHKHHFSYYTFGEWWCNYEFYPYFEVLKKKIVFTRANSTWMNKIMNPLINLSPKFYERFLSFIVPATTIVYILRVRKDKAFQEKQKRHAELMLKKRIDNYKFIREI